MRTPRLKITAQNYDNLKAVSSVLPKHAKGNDSVREALNISAGTWHYLRKSKDFANFKHLREHHNDARIVVKNGKFTQIPEGDGKITLSTDGAPAPRPAHQIVPNLDARAICASIDKNTDALLKLVAAWESTPSKKGWLK